MRFEGSVPIRAARERVWAFVIDPQQVGQCGPGVEKIEVVDATHFKATAKVGIGFISARFVVNMEFADLQPPDWPSSRRTVRRRVVLSMRSPRCAVRMGRTARRS